ncbi:SDR family NAD(P)-dependent oxidoreductase [Falsiroseomonas sp. HW251]|uniref:SDR family NAD(P)-dependent oxidoreductase n=1 Tax=Falsiroseomonas sp. HW251 TaxID=3390998 RepID=UPI003D3108B6
MKRRRALVTGASSGLGAHFAGLLAREGIGTLWLAARSEARLEATLRRCREAGAGDVRPLALDVTDAAGLAASFARIGEAGGLDLLVNNAGIAETAPALEVDPAGFDRVLDTNLRGAWLCATEAARLMRGSGGDIVNIASILGLRVAGGVAPYAISKAGLVQMTRALAVEWARHGIRVNALAPGYVETELNRDFFATEAGAALVRRIPMRRLGRPEDLDAPFLLLASGASTWLTAAVLTVDGGHHASPL